MDKESFKPEMESVYKIQNFIKNYLEKQNNNSKEIYDIDLIIEEIVVNIIKYGFENISKGIIHVEIESLEGKIVLRIFDNGIPFNPLKMPMPDTKAPLKNRRAGGLGIFLVTQKAQRIDYLRENSQNKLTIILRF